MARRWNNLGVRQIRILRLVSTGQKTVEYLVERLGRSNSTRGLIEGLIKGGYMQGTEEKCVITDHGRAVLLSPEAYQKWRKQWGLS